MSTLAVFAFALPAGAQVDKPALSYTSSIPSSSHVLIDISPPALCEKASLKGATCLPVEDLMAPNRRLANISGLLWLLGTAGLDGSEHVLVVGHNASRRDVVAGLLYLAGQKQVSILARPVARIVKEGATSAPGLSRGATREKVYQALMRSEQIVLRNELQDLLRSDAPKAVLDGRSEAEYWGARIRAHRGGHLPGALHSAVSDWPRDGAAKAPLRLSPPVIAYAHDSFESLAYFTRLVAAGVSARVYLHGWIEWAANSSLPVDAETFPTRRAKPDSTAALHAKRSETPNASMPGGSTIALAIGLLVLASVGAFLAGRLSARSG